MKKYKTPVIEDLNLDLSDIIQASGGEAVNYVFTKTADHMGASESWLDSWNDQQ